MPWRLHVYIVNPGDETIYVEHLFYGENKEDAVQVKREHLESCEYFQAAEDEGRTDEEWERIDEEDWPTIDADEG